MIHQIWFDIGHGVKAPHADRQRSFRDLNPDRQYRLWSWPDALAFMKQRCAHMLPLMDALPHGINRCDVFRYILMFYEGGFYFDLDFRCLRKLRVPDSRRVLLCEEWPGSASDATVHNGALYSPPGHLFWLFVLDEVQRRLKCLTDGCKSSKHRSVWCLTGTALLRDVALDTRGVDIAPHTLFCPLIHRCNRPYLPTDSTDLVTHFPHSLCALLPATPTWRSWKIKCN